MKKFLTCSVAMLMALALLMTMTAFASPVLFGVTAVAAAGGAVYVMRTAGSRRARATYSQHSARGMCSAHLAESPGGRLCRQDSMYTTATRTINVARQSRCKATRTGSKMNSTVLATAALWARGPGAGSQNLNVKGATRQSFLRQERRSRTATQNLISYRARDQGAAGMGVMYMGAVA